MESTVRNPKDTQRRKRSRSPGQLLKSGSKSIRGLLKKTKSKSKKKKVDISTAVGGDAKTKTSASVMDGDETVYNVEFDGSVAPSTKGPSASETKSKDLVIAIVLLLMDAGSRRFELIQLSFDASNASVNDILKQIPLSATEESLREQSYNSVCLKDGTVMTNEASLETYLSKINDSTNVLLAVPSGMEPAECNRLASPILSDPKVIAMLKAVEVRKEISTVEEEVEEEEEVDEAEVVETVETPAKEDIVSDAVIEPEKDDVEVSAEVEEAEKPIVLEEAPKSIPEKMEKDDENASDSSYGTLMLTFILLCILTPSIVFIHGRITSQLTPGDTLSVGYYRNTCGVFSVLPQQYTGCIDKVLEMTENGILTLTEFDGETENILWKMQGSCPEEGECIATIEDDGSITIGDSMGKVVKGKKEKKKESVSLTPFPFSIDPTKSKRKK